ncbi:MAG: xanthine dehydrogenase family protein molybdopterin-binding subunit [Caldilineaceae bacterium SB0675_bin_29]|uniref:Xanthine dehydrogenase family protein molybdopterin-binding subunit n=1 Tax=Caldilineaceae bacterium SB0675_bin_29 TaxID=2605266 RepID=A0A6B1FWK5_9CHLR|nr:xanthine dehydrogenase family protein molybdopterin-binding subunit [Caldilineaceae bacterium SB0675_bin_29]
MAENGRSVMSGNYQVVGTRPIRHDGTDKVVGAARYAADQNVPGMLYGKYLRSPHAHARILNIDTSKAEALPGVTAIVTSSDLAEAADKIQEMGEDAVNLRYLSANMLAHDKVLYHGHAIAAVAANSVHVAEEAVGLIDVEYEVLKPVVDVREAMADDAPILLEELRTTALGEIGDKPTNVAQHFRHARGDLEAGYEAADAIVEREFTTAMVHQGYLEPQASTVQWRSDDQIHIWTSTQGPFQIRDSVSALLQVPVSQVKVTPAEIGGGFGGKFTPYTDLPAALLSRKSGNRPVKMALTRTEVLQATGPTSGSYIKVKMGASKDGRITAVEADLIYEAGAYPGSPVGAGACVILSPYKLDNLRIEGYDVVVNRPQSGAYRAPGGTNAAFASETVIDELAEILEIDPLEFRHINAAQAGDRRPDGPEYKRIGYKETVEAAIDHPHTAIPNEGTNRGRGVASGFWFNGAGPSSVTAVVNADGTVNLLEGSADIGGTRASAAMMLAETIGLAAEDINPQVVDTDSIGYTGGTGGSSVTHKIGVTTHQLGLELRRKMSEQLADYWEMDISDITWQNNQFSGNGHNLGFKEAAQELSSGYEALTASVTMNTEGAGPCFGTHIVDVEVDPETGKVEILRYTAVQDVGKAIHPSYVEGQIQGGVVQGIGWALNEEYIYDDEGHLLNASLLDYRMPTALDLPMIESVLVEVANPDHPFGVRGVGEVPIVPPAGAIANAIYDAIGVRPTELPMSPARLLEAIWEKNGA